MIGQKEVDQHIAGIKTSSFFLSRIFLLIFVKRAKANSIAEEPELTIKEYFVPRSFEK